MAVPIMSILQQVWVALRAMVAAKNYEDANECQEMDQMFVGMAIKLSNLCT